MDFSCSALVLLIVEALVVITSPLPQQQTQQAPVRQFFEMDTEKLKDFWHTAMIRGLIKAHSKQILKDLPYVEHVVYNLCTHDAKTTVALAKCAVRVFDLRDATQQRIEYEQRQPVVSTSNFLERHPLTRVIHGTRSSKWTGVTKFLYRDAKKKRFFHKQKRGNKRKRKKRNAENRRDDDDRNDPVGTFGTLKTGTQPKILPKYNFGNPKERLRPAMNFGRVVSEYMKKVLLGSKPRSHLENLRVIRDHFRRVEKCNDFFQSINNENRRFFEKMNLGIDSRTPELANNAIETMEGVLETVNAFAAHASMDKLSVMSPRLFSLFPETSQSSNKQFLSPTIFSFQNDGYLSLPELFDIIAINKKQQNRLLDIIMDVSGAGKALEETLVRIKPEIEEVKYIKLPLVQEISRKHEKWIRARNHFTEEQKMDYEEKGYAFLNEEQLNLIYNRQEQLLHGINVTELSRMTKEQKTKRIERDIRALAALDQPSVPTWGTKHFRKRRATPPSADPELKENEERINGVLFETLQPYAFTAEVAEGAALEVVTLSPEAFINEILFPRALRLEVLSPRAFIAAVLSPNALIARILSPTAFRVEVLSPRALHTWVLSPEVFLAEILSPRFLDPRVLSPQALVFEVLSPGILSPHYGSSEAASLIVLSPNILSPRIRSEERMLVEVLSPHILGGAHSHEEAEHTVSEIGAHSDHIHGDEEHERAEGSHHSHEIEEETVSGLPPWIHIVNGR